MSLNRIPINFIEGISLPTIEQIEKNNLGDIGNSFFLKDKVQGTNDEIYVCGPTGKIHHAVVNVSDVRVRPVITLSSVPNFLQNTGIGTSIFSKRLQNKDPFKAEYEWLYIGDNQCILNGTFFYNSSVRFDDSPTNNDYDYSYIKSYLETWLDSAKAFSRQFIVKFSNDHEVPAYYNSDEIKSALSRIQETHDSPCIICNLYTGQEMILK